MVAPCSYIRHFVLSGYLGVLKVSDSKSHISSKLPAMYLSLGYVFYFPADHIQISSAPLSLSRCSDCPCEDRTPAADWMWGRSPGSASIGIVKICNVEVHTYIFSVRVRGGRSTSRFLGDSDPDWLTDCKRGLMLQDRWSDPKYLNILITQVMT